MSTIMQILSHLNPGMFESINEEYMMMITTKDGASIRLTVMPPLRNSDPSIHDLCTINDTIDLPELIDFAAPVDVQVQPDSKTSSDKHKDSAKPKKKKRSRDHHSDSPKLKKKKHPSDTKSKLVDVTNVLNK